MTNAMTEIFGEAISTYSRAQAIEDGTLVEVPATVLREAGIRFPVAMTSAAYAECVAVPLGLEGSQDVAGRLWDIVYLLSVAIRRGVKGSQISYKVRVRKTARRSVDVQIVSVCGPGDDMEPVITLLLPGED